MSAWRRSGVAVAAAVLATLLLAGAALGQFGGQASGGPLSVSSATLDTPGMRDATNIRCNASRRVRIRVRWNASTSPAVQGYDVLRSDTSGGPYTVVGSVPVGTQRYVDTIAAPFGPAYYYVVRATRNGWTSGDSTEASATTC
jgi:hypothetical protein